MATYAGPKTGYHEKTRDLRGKGGPVADVFVIAQGGGPTAVINQTVAGATLEARRRDPGAKVLGARHGVRGVRSGDFVDLSRLSESDLRRFAETPNAGLGSTRDKPNEAYCAQILDGLRKVGARATWARPDGGSAKSARRERSVSSRLRQGSGVPSRSASRRLARRPKHVWFPSG